MGVRQMGEYCTFFHSVYVDLFWQAIRALINATGSKIKTLGDREQATKFGKSFSNFVHYSVSFRGRDLVSKTS